MAKKEKAEEKSEKKNGVSLTSHEIKEIENMVKNFWGSTGKNVDVDEWDQYPEGRKVLHYLGSDRRNDAYFAKCPEYNKCVEKYQLKRGENANNYDESMVDFEKLSTPIGVAFIMVCSGLPKFLLSDSNMHTTGYFMSKWKDGGMRISEIMKTAQEKIGVEPGKKKDKEEKDDKKKQSPEDKKKRKRFLFVFNKAKDHSKGKENASNENEKSDAHEEKTADNQESHKGDEQSQGDNGTEQEL